MASEGDPFGSYQIEWHDPVQLEPYPHNARTHSDEQIARICNSIREFGWTNPILIDEDGGIIAGHGRAEAAKRLGIRSVPCLRLSELDADQRRAYVIADNKLALDAGWDMDLLRLELGDLREVGFDLTLTGFDELAAEDILQGGTGGEGGSGGGQDDNGLQLLVVSTDARLISLLKARIGVPDETNRVSAHDLLRVIGGLLDRS